MTTRKPNPARSYLSRLTPEGRRTQRRALVIAAEIIRRRPVRDPERFPWERVRYRQTARVRAAIAERYAPKTANRILSALRSVLRESWRLDLIDAETYQRAADIEGVRGSSLPRGRALEARELEALYRVCSEDASPAGLRDAAVLSLCYAAGLRRAEVAHLELEDVELATGAVRVYGKGRKERITYLGEGLAWIKRWLELRGPEPGALIGQIFARRVIVRELSERAIHGIVTGRAKKAGIRHCTPHDLRRTFASELLDAGGDIETVGRLLGHKSNATTGIYDMRGEGAKVRLQKRLVVPLPGSAG